MDTERMSSRSVGIIAGIVLALLPIITIVLLPNYVPAHRIVQAQLFGVMGIITLLVLIVTFLTNAKYYFFSMVLILPVVPYFTSYLSPMGGRLLSALPEVCLSLILALISIDYIIKIGLEKSAVNPFIFFWILANTISLMFSKNISTTLPPYLLVTIVASLYLFVLDHVIFSDDKGYYALVKYFLLSGVLYIFFGATLTADALGARSISDLITARMGETVNTAYFGSNAYGGNILLFLPILFWASVISNRFKIYLKCFFAAALLLGFSAILITVSRGNLIGLAFVLIFWAVYFMRGKSKIITWIALIGLIAVLTLFISKSDLFYTIMGRFFASQEVSLNRLIERTLYDTRFVLWENSLDIFMDYWYAGVGMGNLRPEMIIRTGYDLNAHNFILNILTQQGLFVFLILMWAGISLIGFLGRALKLTDADDKWLVMSCYTSLGAYLIQSNITGGAFMGVEFVGSYKACWLFTIGMMIYYKVKRYPSQPAQESWAKGSIV